MKDSRLTTQDHVIQYDLPSLDINMQIFATVQ